ncbi:MAG: potassium-transporting ATPase subunit KdpC [Candidatus Dormibacteraeota bacterium]|uniref:Potassium-transporting ATPase KdpC subunit n=1 Tax=Candidatus Nephthysia bennettiae TaxID=3127016 RepID=A0A934NAR9_9BACT|nr:potassium-transporting ATPase subunit KdpC [Candidatus Dormibacteraeota bacterium]MBJ7612721.1 potassium-transporting ATPase subunit KdpC [Candidatus Dormibacteraeota bacterium]
MPSELVRALRLTLVVAVVTGLIYPLVITGAAQVAFHDQANGSLVTKNGQTVGSRLIGQYFTKPEYFHGRLSSTVDPSNPTRALPYNAANSAGSNLGPSNKALIDRVSKDVNTTRQENGLPSGTQVPVDLVTSDFSGVDPDVSEAAALIQVNRVASARNLDPAKVRSLIERHVQGRVLGMFGEAHVNVLDVNMALDSGEAR